MYRYQINTPQHTPTEHRLPGGVVTRPPIRQTKQTAQETLNTRYSKKNLLVPLIHCVPTGITGLSLHSGMWDVAKVRCQMVSPLIKHSGGAGQQIQKFHLDILSFLFIHFAGARNTNTDTIHYDRFINTSYQKLPLGSGDDPDKLITYDRFVGASY